MASTWTAVRGRLVLVRPRTSPHFVPDMKMHRQPLQRSFVCANDGAQQRGPGNEMCVKHMPSANGLHLY